MRRLIDFIREEKWHPPAWSDVDRQEWDIIYKRRLPLLKSAQIFVIDNVAEYVFLTRDNSKVHSDDLPCVAPPYQNFFMEWKDPNPNVKDRYPLMGVHFLEQEDIREVLLETVVSEGAAQKIRETLGKTEFLTVAELYVTDSKGVPSGPLVSWILFINKEGALITKPFSTMAGVSEINESNHRLIEVRKVMEGFLAVPLFALCFLHCKNIVQRTVEPSPKLSKKHKRKHGVPLTKFKILEIEPLKTILRREGKSEETGLKKAIHLCRGHFKNFREGRGLFGRHKGMYFWHPQVRGSKEKGVVLKDYKIKEPQKTT